MRVVVVGATGTVGASVVQALIRDHTIDHVVGLARHLPSPTASDATPTEVTSDVEWIEADMTVHDLAGQFAGADAVVHCAWLLQPAHDARLLHDVNIVGSARVFEAVAQATVGALVYLSSFSAYSPGRRGEVVDETWPTNGIPTSTYSQHKAYVERLLDEFELRHPLVRVVRLRPGLILKPGAGIDIERRFLGNWLPLLMRPLARRSVLPDLPGMAFQAVHSEDVAEACRLALLGSVVGAYNLAAEPAIDTRTLADTFGYHRIPVSVRTVRTVTAAAWLLRLQPSEPGWIDLVLQTPTLDPTRAHRELGWEPAHSALETIRAFVDRGRRSTSSAAMP